jgi:penicillin-binding protein 1A
MEALLVKVFAVALALSQVTTRPDAIKTQFDPATDKTEVLQLLGAGCDHVRKSFDLENIDLDDLIATVMTDKQAVAGEIAAFRGIKFTDLHTAYKQICKHEKVANSVVDVDQLIEFYNRAVADLPDHSRLKDLHLPGMTTVLDGKGAKFAELFEPDNRRHWVPLADIPEFVQKAFVAAEDKRFFEHNGVDERSVIRAFINMIAEPNKRQGGSTITQQVAKNLLVGDSITYERKIREIIVANRIEKTISKQQVLEIYLNSIYLGRSAWGVELAAQAYFGKSIKNVTLTEGAFLAGLTKGPAYYDPARYRERAHGRLAYVLSRMQDDGAINQTQFKEAQAERLNVAVPSRPRRTTGFHLVDEVGREARTLAGIPSLTAQSYEVRSTIRPDLQRATEAALQDGLAAYEQGAGRVEFRGPEANLGDAIRKLAADPNADRGKPAWQVALQQVRLPLYDVHWTPAVIVERVAQRGGGELIRVGLSDGRVLPLSTSSGRARARLATSDVIYVKVVEGSGKQGARVEMRVRPVVQGAALVMENRTGRIVAMAGGFSYPLSQLNRVTQARRQPGSSFKPITYLAALNHGLQPNTLLNDSPLTYPPIGGATRYSRAEDYWSPQNYDGGYSGTITMRRALEHSKNVATARLLDGGIGETPKESLDAICALARESQLVSECMRYYPFVLGAQPVRPIDLAAFYAAIYNEGARPTPHVIDEIVKDGQTIYRAKDDTKALPVDRAAAFQLRSLMQGVVARGTAARLASLSAYIAGKTGTTDEFNDSWFAGFSNDITIVVWVGYDNARGKRTLGHGQAGSRVALPIFERIIQAAWTQYPRTPLVGPSREAARHLVALPIDGQSGERVDSRGYGAFMEYFRLGPDGRYIETVYQLMSRGSEYDIGESSNPFGSGPFGLPWFFGGRDYDGSPTMRGGFPPTSRGNWRPPEDDLRYMPPMRMPQETYQQQPGYRQQPRTLPQQVQPPRDNRLPPPGARRAEPGYWDRR